MTLSRIASSLISLALAITTFACGHSSGTVTAADGSTGDDASTGDDGGAGDSATSDASNGDANGTDGTPMRRQCTAALGNGLTTTFGRLDGYLVAIVPVDQRSCNGDSTHVHLQVLAQNAIYDVAVNVDGLFHQQDLAPPGAAWSEGWHTGVSDSYASLGVHSTQFMASTVAQLGPVVEAALANANHITVWATGYGPTGVHLVHYKGRGTDGMVVINPLSPTAHALMFAFQGDTF